MANLSIKSEALGSSETVKTYTITGRTLGGKVYQVRPVSWPILFQRDLTFKNLKKQVKDDLVNFLVINRAKGITITDNQTGETIYGMISNPRILIRNMTYNYTLNCALYEVTFTVQGKIT